MVEQKEISFKGRHSRREHLIDLSQSPSKRAVEPDVPTLVNELRDLEELSRRQNIHIGKKRRKGGRKS